MVARVVLLMLLLTAGLASAADPVQITDICQQLTTHVPDADVEYKAGKDIDTNGNPIAPADLDGGLQPIKLPAVTHVLITVDQAQRLGLSALPTPYKPEAIIGDVTVNQSGDVYFNGQRISQPQVQALCNDPRPPLK